MSSGKRRLTGADLLKLEGQYPDKRLELINGELRFYPPNGWQHAAITSDVAFRLTQYERQYQIGTVLAGAAGFYTRGDAYTVRMSDAAFVSYQRQPRDTIPSDYGSTAPELVVEIIAPEDSPAEIEAKIQEWLNFGVLMVWVIFSKQQYIRVYQPDSSLIVYMMDDTMTGGDVLPGFSAKVSQFFEE